MRSFKILSIVVFTLYFALHASAQQSNTPDDPAEKIKALQIAYLAKKLDLTPEEAQKFWPVYNNYSREVEKLIAERESRANPDRADRADIDNAARKAMDKELGFEKRMLDIKSRYNREFLKVLPARKAGNIYRSEREFRGMMIRQLKERQHFQQMNNNFRRGGRP